MTDAEDQDAARKAAREAEEVARRHWLKRLHARLHAHPVTGAVTKVVITIAGLVVIAVGVVLSGPGIPGPGFVVIIAGLALLATEWSWAERLLTKARAALKKQTDKVRAMDPAVRRRRAVLGTLAVVVVCGATALLIWQYGWPGLAVSSWDRIQSFSSLVPELPGME